MSHLRLETLARLVDEAPDTEEAAHLTACAACRVELDALREQSQGLSTLPAIVAAPDAWPRLRDRLRAERLIRTAGGRRWSEPARAAAALLLFLAGGATGYVARGAPAAVPGPEAVALDPGEPASAAARPGSSEQDLTRAVVRAEDEYFAALDRFMASTTSPAHDPAARLAVLDHIVLTTAEALAEAPSDPVINSYYLTALAQRNAVLRQITGAGPEPIF